MYMIIYKAYIVSCIFYNYIKIDEIEVETIL